MDSYSLFSLGALMIGAVVLRHWLRRPYQKAKLARPTPLDALPVKAGTPQQVRWEVHMHEVARDLAGAVDTKIVLVNQLVRMLEERSAELRNLLERADAAGLLAPTERARAERLLAASLAGPATPSPYEPDAGPQLPEVRPGPSPTAATTGRPTALPLETEDRACSGPALPLAAAAARTEIYRLRDHGLPATAIAATVHLPVADVEWTLSLRNGG